LHFLFGDDELDQPVIRFLFHSFQGVEVARLDVLRQIDLSVRTLSQQTNPLEILGCDLKFLLT
jgi:hypothetical protein